MNKMNLKIKVLTITALALAWIGCTTNNGGSVPQIVKCCTDLAGNEVLSTDGAKCDGCCTSSGAANPNPEPSLACGVPKEKQISDQIASALDSVQRGATALNSANDLTGTQISTTTNVISQAATASDVPGNKPKPTSDIKKNLLEIPSLNSKVTNSGGSGFNGNSGGGGGLGGSAGYAPPPSEVAAVVADGQGLDSGESPSGIYAGGGAAKAADGSGGSRGIASVFGAKGGIRGFDQASDGAALNVGRLGGELADSQDRDSGDYFFRISRAASLFKQISRKYDQISYDWVLGDSKKAMR